jgi:hypothetical protein
MSRICNSKTNATIKPRETRAGPGLEAGVTGRSSTIREAIPEYQSIGANNVRRLTTTPRAAHKYRSEKVGEE